jgi:hypothetical protein
VLAGLRKRVILGVGGDGGVQDGGVAGHVLRRRVEEEGYTLDPWKALA